MMDYEDDDDNPSGIVLLEPEIKVVTELLTEGGYDHMRLVWQGKVGVLWPMRMRPLDYTNMADAR